MRRWMVLLLLIAMAGSAPARAAKIGVYFDEYGETSRRQVDPGKAFSFYVAVSQTSGDLYAFECRLDIDPRLTVTSRELLHASAIAIGSGDPDNWMVGMGQSVPLSGTVALLRYGAVLLAGEEGLWIGLAPAVNPNEPPANAPRYILETDTDKILEFDDVGGAVLNSEVGSWGELKDVYQNR